MKNIIMSKSKRKIAKDYRKEHQELFDKTNALETRIKNRLLELCRQYPDIIITNQIDSDKTPIKAKSINNPMYIDNLDVKQLLIYIENIERALNDLEPYQQGNLFN